MVAFDMFKVGYRIRLPTGGARIAGAIRTVGLEDGSRICACRFKVFCVCECLHTVIGRLLVIGYVQIAMRLEGAAPRHNRAGPASRAWSIHPRPGARATAPILAHSNEM